MKTSRKGNITKFQWFDTVNQQLHIGVSVKRRLTLATYIYESPIMQAGITRAKENLSQVHKQVIGLEFARFIGIAGK